MHTLHIFDYSKVRYVVQEQVAIGNFVKLSTWDVFLEVLASYGGKLTVKLAEMPLPAGAVVVVASPVSKKAKEAGKKKVKNGPVDTYGFYYHRQLRTISVKPTEGAYIQVQKYQPLFVVVNSVDDENKICRVRGANHYPPIGWEVIQAD